MARAGSTSPSWPRSGELFLSRAWHYRSIDGSELRRDLADFENKGYLTKDTFAVAMHLVKKAVADPSFILPDSLPANLRPPSTSSHKAGAGAGQVQRDLLDLMGDDDEAPSTPAAAPAQRSLSPQLTGQRTPIPPPIQATMQPLPLSPQGTGQPQRIGSLSPQATGGSARAMGSGLGSGMAPSPLATRGGGFGDDFAPASSPALAPPAPPPQQQQQKTSSTFFDENDDADLAATASSLSSRASALRSEQAGVSKDLESTTASRAELEQQVQSHNKEIESLQAQVAAAREAFETERTRVDELRARRDEQKRVLDRARHELISAQSDLSGLRMEKTEVEGEVLRDKEEVREVKRQVAMVEEEKRILAAEIDKIRKDLRREKGLGAIARKQLASVEADRARLESDLERARAGNLEGDAETGEAEKGIVTAKDEAALAATAPTAPAAHAAAVPLPATPAAGIASPAASTRSTNPFDRFTQPQNQHQMGLSPQPTGGSASTNPFASFGTHAQPQERAIETPQQQQHDEKTSLPVAAAAAIGTGALAALGAAGAGIAHAVGVGKDGDEDKKQADQEPRAAQDGDAGTDPFGVPSTVEAKDARDDGFGDDFAASTAQPSAGGFEDDAFNVTPTATTAPAGADDGFDDEFKAFDSATPAASSAAGPVQGTLGEIDSSAGFTDAVRDLSEGKGPDAVEGTLGEVDKDAGFDEAFHEVEDHQQASSTEHEATEAGAKLDKGKEKAVEHDVFGEGGVGNSTPPRADYNSDSDDDEAEGPEEAFGTTRPHQRDLESSADESGFATPAAASTDLGASSVADVAAVTGAAPLAHDAEAGPTAELASRGAGEQARTNDSSESGESYVHVDVGPTGTAESVDMLESPAPASFQPASPAVTPTQRRAAPPPPQRSAVPAISTPPAVSPFSGDADKGVATVGTEVEQPASKPEDDFESAFADMDVSSPPGTSSINAPTSTTQPDLDSFDNDFDFQPSFDEAEAVSSAQTAHNLAAVQTEVAPNDFDDAAFADFDSTFARDAPQAQTQAQAERADDGFDSAFDDSFGATPASAAAAAPALTTGEGAEGGAPALGAPLDSASTAPSVPQYAPPPGPPPPPKHHSTATVGDEDSDAVKMIKQMGFSREQAVDALEKYDVRLVSLALPVESSLTGLLLAVRRQPRRQQPRRLKPAHSTPPPHLRPFMYYFLLLALCSTGIQLRIYPPFPR